MPSHTTYNPSNANDFEKTKLVLAAQGVSAVAPNGQTTNMDLTLTDDCLLTGVVFFTNGNAYGDYVSLQVVDATGVTGAPPGTVLLTTASSWYIYPGQYLQIDTQYPAKVLAGLTLRIVYTNVGIGLGSTQIFINYKLHKCLV